MTGVVFEEDVVEDELVEEEVVEGDELVLVEVLLEETESVTLSVSIVVALDTDEEVLQVDEP